MYAYDIVLGLPHTNYGGLAEFPFFLAHAGHFQWTSIARAIGHPLSSLRTLSKGEVYATFYFVEERFPAGRPITAFKLDDCLRFAVFLRGFKNIAVEGQILFDEPSRLAPTLAESGEACPVTHQHPYIRFGNIFITPEGGNSALRVAPPATGDFSLLPPLPNEENPYQLTRAAEATGELGLLVDGWTPLDGQALRSRYAIDPDRDTNGAGLVYFANYVAFMDAAERTALVGNGTRAFTPEDIAARALQHRRIAYYGNVAPDDAIVSEVSLFFRQDDRRALGARYAISREYDGRVICRSEAIKVLPAPRA